MLKGERVSMAHCVCVCVCVRVRAIETLCRSLSQSLIEEESNGFNGIQIREQI